MDLTCTYTLTPEQQQQWLRFWKKTRHSHPRQHFAMGDIEAAKGRKPVFVFGFEGDTIVAIGLFSIRPLLTNNKRSLEAFCLSGPVFDDPVYLNPFLTEVINVSQWG